MLWLLAAMALAADEAPALQIEVQTYTRPRSWPERLPVDRPALPITKAPSIRLDGRFDEAEWLLNPGPPPLPLATGRPVDPAWGLTALQTPVGLAIAMRGLTQEHAITIVVDPDGTHRGWTKVELKAGNPRWLQCGPPHPLPETVVPLPLRNVAWQCAEQDGTGIAAEIGDAGYEVLIPWAALGRTTEQMKVLWWFTGPDHTGGTWDLYGGKPAFSQAGREVQVVGRARKTSGWVTTDLEHGKQSFHVSSPGLAAPEAWRWQTTWDGVVLHEGAFQLTPENGGRVELPIAERPSNATIALAWREQAEPLRPGAQGRFYQMDFWTSLTTPVFDDELVFSFHLRDPAKGVQLQVLDERGERIIAEQPIDLPRGQGHLRITASERWPDRVRIRVGSLLPEDTALAIRRGSTGVAR